MNEKAPGVELTEHALPDGTRLAAVNATEVAYLYEEIFRSGCYSPVELRMPAAPTVLDLGANIGMFTLYATWTWPGARVIAVEPIPETFRALEANCAGVGATPFQVAVGSREAEQDLLFFPRMTLMSCAPEHVAGAKATLRRYLHNTHDGLADSPGTDDALDELVAFTIRGSSRRVKVTTVSELIRRCGLETVDLMKIDVEGSEREVLQGIADEDWPRFGAVVCEVDAATGALAGVVALLERRGFAVRAAQDVKYAGTSLHIVTGLKPGWTAE